MNTAEKEMERRFEYDVRLVNDDLDEATKKLVAIVRD